MTEKAVVKRKLTMKEQKFCQEYLVDLNATQAARRAGYSLNNSRQVAAELLTKYPVYSKIQELFRKRSNKTELKAEEVIDDLRWVVKETKASGDTKAYMSAVKALELLGKHIGMFEERLRIIHQDRSNSELVSEMLSSADVLSLVIDELGELGYRVEVIDGHVTRLN
tara:strand:+ start:583 stop:1083 length:501 start_codon:yes stop_codon:yes gene_type:complete